MFIIMTMLAFGVFLLLLLTQLPGLKTPEGNPGLLSFGVAGLISWVTWLSTAIALKATVPLFMTEEFDTGPFVSSCVVSSIVFASRDPRSDAPHLPHSSLAGAADGGAQRRRRRRHPTLRGREVGGARCGGGERRGDQGRRSGCDHRAAGAILDSGTRAEGAPVPRDQPQGAAEAVRVGRGRWRGRRADRVPLHPKVGRRAHRFGRGAGRVAGDALPFGAVPRRRGGRAAAAALDVPPRPQDLQLRRGPRAGEHMGRRHCHHHHHRQLHLTSSTIPASR